mgnify:FL=1
MTNDDLVFQFVMLLFLAAVRLPENERHHNIKKEEEKKTFVST